MTAENVKGLLNAEPFRPFRICLPSGKSVLIPHADFAAISPSGRTLVVLGERESQEIIDIRLIERIETEAAA